MLMKFFFLLSFGFYRLVLGSNDMLINGAGATFPYPLYSKWFTEFQKKNPEIRINYQSIGSGGGIRQLTEATVDFGASDSPMTDEQLAKSSTPIIHIPTALGAVVVTYHPGVSTESLKLTPELIADLFSGKIKKWEDPRLRAHNPGLKATGDVFIVHRADGSGTTGIFTDYLSKVNADWKAKVGHGTSVKWPTGIGGKGNEGVTQLVKQMPGAVGYVELIYAQSNHLPVADVQNQGGVFVKPSLASVSASAKELIKAIPEDFRVSLTDPPGKAAYPISGFTYLLVHSKAKDAAKGAAFIKFLEWAVSEGQSYNEALHYSKLPESLVPQVKAKIRTLQSAQVP